MYMEAFLFGVTIAIAIGPIALLIVNASLTRGIAAGIACGAGAASADFTFALLAFTAGSGVLALLDAWRDTLALVAATVLCGLGAWLILLAWRERHRDIAAARIGGPGFRATYFLTLANPLTIVFFAAWLGARRAGIGGADVFGFAFAVFAGSLLVQIALALGGGLLRRIFAQPGARLAANVLSGLGIFGFGVLQLARA